MTALQVNTGIASVNGARLYYEVAGTGTPVVLIHGLGLDTRMWDDQFETLADRYRVIRYDVRGFGKSSLPDDSAFRNSDDLRALLDYSGAPQAHVVGLSMGGIVALHHALRHPEATLSLVLVDSALDGHPWTDKWDESLDAIAEHAQRAGAKAGNARWLAHELFAPARERPAVRAKLEQIVGDYSGWNWLHESSAQGIDPRSAQRLHEISVPTLVIVGERDIADFQTISETLTQEIPAARKVVLKNVGHMCNMENTPEFNALLLSFLDEVESLSA